MDRPWEAFDRARRVLRGRDDLVGWKSADLPSVRDQRYGAAPKFSSPAAGAYESGSILLVLSNRRAQHPPLPILVAAS